MTFNIIGRQFPQSGRMSNLLIRTWKDWFIFRDCSAESGRVGSPGVFLGCLQYSVTHPVLLVSSPPHCHHHRHLEEVFLHHPLSHQPKIKKELNEVSIQVSHYKRVLDLITNQIIFSLLGGGGGINQAVSATAVAVAKGVAQDVFYFNA